MSRFIGSNINSITNNSNLGFVTNKGERGTILSDLYHDKFIPAVLNKTNGCLQISFIHYDSKKQWIESVNDPAYVGIVKTVHLFEEYSDMYKWLIEGE